MRLIDADKLIENFKRRYNELDIEDMLEFMYISQLINSQPTVFDVDNVLEKLDELVTINIEVLNTRADYVQLEQVKKLIKAGGIDDR